MSLLWPNLSEKASNRHQTLSMWSMSWKTYPTKSAQGLMQGALVHVILTSRIPKEVQIMNRKFYKMRRNRMISGVLAGLSDSWDLDVTLVRFVFAIFTIANFGLGIIIYIILAYILPTKEDIEADMYGTGPRKIKQAEPIDDDKGWFW